MPGKEYQQKWAMRKAGGDSPCLIQRTESTVHGHISFGFKTSIKWHSSRYDECREYGNLILFGSEAAFSVRPAFSVPRPLTEASVRDFTTRFRPVGSFLSSLTPAGMVMHIGRSAATALWRYLTSESLASSDRVLLSLNLVLSAYGVSHTQGSIPFDEAASVVGV